MECTSTISRNFWDFYFLKSGIRKEATLFLNTRPDIIKLNLSREDLKHNKSLFKILFKLIKNSRLQYYKNKNKFIISTEDGKTRKELDFDVYALETIERALPICNDIKDYDNDFFLIDIQGMKFLIRKKVSSDIYVIWEGFARNQYSFIYPFLKNAIVIDIGTNIGDTAILFCTKGARKVYAYEPHPFFFEMALKNIELNNLNSKVMIYPYGIGTREEKIVIKDDSLMGPTGSFGSKKIEGAKERELSIVPFSKILESIKDIDVLKMDCEGAEFDAIFSCPIPLLKKIKILAIEAHDNPAKLIKYLEDIGFDIKIIGETQTGLNYKGMLFGRMSR